MVNKDVYKLQFVDVHQSYIAPAVWQSAALQAACVCLYSLLFCSSDVLVDGDNNTDAAVSPEQHCLLNHSTTVKVSADSQTAFDW